MGFLMLHTRSARPEGARKRSICEPGARRHPTGEGAAHSSTLPGGSALTTHRQAPAVGTHTVDTRGDGVNAGRCSAAFPFGWPWDRRWVSPSIAITSRCTRWIACTQARKLCRNGSGSIRATTQSKVSCAGMPFGNARNVASHADLLRPNAAWCALLQITIERRKYV